MTASTTDVRDRIMDTPSVPQHAVIARDFTESIDLGIPELPDRIQVQEVLRIGSEDVDRSAEAMQVLFVSLTLLVLFVAIFVGYLVLDVAQLM
jgi:hypothetical protein